MKKILTFCLFVFMITPLFSQQLAVKSFIKLPYDMNARVDEPIKDQNGDICAIIKVVTTQTGFSFDFGQIGFIKQIPKPSEIWVYVPYGVKRLTISHPNLGILRDYPIPLAVEKATVYEMVLVSGKVTTIVEEGLLTIWLTVRSNPDEAPGSPHSAPPACRRGAAPARRCGGAGSLPVRGRGRPDRRRVGDRRTAPHAIGGQGHEF